MTASKIGNGSRVTSAFVSQHIRSSQIDYCYTYGLLCAERGIIVPRNSLADRAARINCIKRLIRRCHALQRAKDLRDTVMSRLRRQNRLCSSTVSDTANRLLKRTDSEGSSSVAEKKSSVVPLFRSGRRSLICANPRNKGRWSPKRIVLILSAHGAGTRFSGLRANLRCLSFWISQPKVGSHSQYFSNQITIYTTKKSR